MTLAASTRLGSYEIIATIGSGGMGEVYQAHDTKLGRDVAIKVLPEAFAHDPETLSRFQREAKMLASLNHPNIATIHGLEQSNGTSYLVMELVPGETLQERIRRDGPVPVEEALSIAKQIAEALEAAHEKGIIHRDLKPANVKVTLEGKVKVLDFGLAKAFAEDTETSDPINSPTLSMAATMHGVILGTAAYMSPEQARGKAVDKRTDIWAFGCVLYELLCGRSAFEGEDVTEILAAVVKSEPDWTKLPKGTPRGICILLRRCLRKDRQHRLRDAADARIEVEDALTAPSIGPEAPATGWWRRPIPLSLAALAVVAVSVVAGAAVWFLKPSRPQATQTVMRFRLSLPTSERLPAGPGNHLDFSPDGAHIAYASVREDGSRQLYMWDIGGLQPKPIASAEGGGDPVFSPDGQWVAFVADRKLKKILIAGGDAVTLCDLQNPRGVSWGPSDTLVFADLAKQPGIWQVSSAGGTPKLLVAPDAQSGERLFWPEMLPGARAVLFAAGDEYDWGEEQIAVQELGTGKRRILVEGGTYPRYLRGGYLLYMRGGTLMAAPFDLVNLRLTAAPVPVVEGIGQSLDSGAAHYSVASNGSLVYVPTGSWQQAETLVWEDRRGTIQATRAPPSNFIFPSLSPDGNRLAVAVEGPRSQIWVYDISSERFTRFTYEGGNRFAVWTPDGSRIAYVSFREGSQRIFWRLADGSGAEEQLIARSGRLFPTSFSPDGRILAFTAVDAQTGYDIWMLPLNGEGKPRPFLQTPAFEGGAMFSPDGHWLAYTSDESGRYEVYVQPFPGPGGKWQVSTEGGQQPRWGQNGRELFYLGLDGQTVIAADVITQPEFSASKPRVISQTQGFAGITPPLQSNYDVAPDGQRFLRAKPTEWAELPAQINVALNWLEELKQKVPAGKK